MKILYLMKSMDIGGAEKICLELCKSVSSSGNKVFVASSKGIYSNELKNAGIKHKLIPKLFLSGSFFFPFLVLIIKYILVTNRIDLIHSHHRITTVACQLCKTKKQKLIYTAHNIFHDFYQRLLYPDCAVGVSDTVYENLIETLRLTKSKICRIYNGVELPTNIIDKSFNNNVRIGYVGRFIEQKGVIKIFESVKRILEEGYKTELIYIGEGPLKPKLEKLINAYKLVSSIKILAPIIQTEVIYKNFDILVLPTSFNEGLPLVILEGMAYNKLVIASDIKQIRELIIDGENGYLVNTADPLSLYKILRKVINSYKIHSELKFNAKETITKKFLIENMLSEYTKIYDRYLPIKQL